MGPHGTTAMQKGQIRDQDVRTHAAPGMCLVPLKRHALSLAQWVLQKLQGTTPLVRMRPQSIAASLPPRGPPLTILSTMHWCLGRKLVHLQSKTTVGTVRNRGIMDH